MKQITNFPNYVINEQGIVKNISTKRTLKPFFDRYFGVSLYQNFKIKRRWIHRLLAIEFIPNPENKAEVNHINGIKTDNRLENLEWCTHSENGLHSARVLKNHVGEGHEQSKLTEQQVREIRQKYIRGIYGCIRLGNEYGVSDSTIRQLIRRDTWKCVL